MSESNIFCLKLSEDEKTVYLTVQCTSRERAILLYEGLEKTITQLSQADLENYPGKPSTKRENEE